MQADPVDSDGGDQSVKLKVRQGKTTWSVFAETRSTWLQAGSFQKL